MPHYTPGRRRAIILLLLTSVLLLTLDLRGNAVFDAARTGFSKALDPFESAAEVVTRPARDAWRGITDYDELAEENQRLREQLDAARSDQITAQATIIEHQELLRLNSLPALSDYPTIVATVVGQSPSNLDQVIEINKGSDDGIEVGMAVVEAGLVGKITTVLPDRARVMLLTDARYAVAVKVAPGESTTTTIPTEPIGGSTVPPEGSTPVNAGATSSSSSSSSTSSSSTTSTTSTTTTTSTLPADPDGSTPSTSSPSTTSSSTTTTIDPDTLRETGRMAGQGANRLPQVDLLADTPLFGRLQVGDIILTAGGTDSLAPLDIPVGVVANVISRSTAEGPLLEVEPLADLDQLHFVRIVIYKPESEADPATGSAVGGGGDWWLMLASLLQGPLLRLASVGLIVVALQRTLFAELRPAGVVVQIVLALAAAAGAAGGPQKGALAGFVLGLMYDLGVGTPLGSSSITMGIGGFTAGYVMTITNDPQWWLAALFTAVGAAVGEAAVPVVRAFIGEEQVFSPRLATIVPVVAAAAMVMSPVLVPVGRWCMQVKRPEWKAPKE